MLKKAKNAIFYAKNVKKGKKMHFFIKMAKYAKRTVKYAIACFCQLLKICQNMIDQLITFIF